MYRTVYLLLLLATIPSLAFAQPVVDGTIDPDESAHTATEGTVPITIAWTSEGDML